MNILKNRKYLGHTVNFKTQKHFKDKKSHYVDESEWTIFENTHEAIIDQATFDNVPTRYGKVKALKESSTLFDFLQENGVYSIRELYAKVAAMQTEYYGLRSEIAATDRQIDGVKKRLSMWKQYADNKPYRQRLASLKPRARSAYQDERYTELALYDAAVRYLDGLKASGEKIYTSALAGRNRAPCRP